MMGMVCVKTDEMREKGRGDWVYEGSGLWWVG